MPLRAFLAAIACVLLLVSSVGAQDVEPEVDGLLLSTARTGHSATSLGDGRVLVAGGSDGLAELDSVEVIDAVGLSTELLGSLLEPRAGHSASLLPDGRVLIAGGRTGESILATAEIFDPATGQSKPTGPMRWARADHEAVLLGNGRVMLVAGVADSAPVARAELFDTASEAFQATAKAKAVHQDPAVAALPDGRVLVMGAAVGKKGRPAQLYMPGKDKWSAIKKAPKRVGHSATPLPDGRVLVLGGSDGSVELAAVESFDPARPKPVEVGDLERARSHHTATLLPDGRVLVVGGSEDGLETSTIEVFDIGTGASLVLDAPLLPRTGHTATSLPDGRVLVTGGDFAGLALDDISVFDPATDSLAPLGGSPLEADADVATIDLGSGAEVRAAHGTPDAFVIYYFDELTADGAVVPVVMEQWTYYNDGLEFVLEDDTVVAQEPVAIDPDVEADPAPYDPGQFSAYMSLDEVVAAAGLEEYAGGPVDEMVEGGELFLADRLAWGMKDDELRYVEALALEAVVTQPEEDA